MIKISNKGEGQIDYIIAIGIFIIIFGITINYVTNYFSTVEDPMRLTTLRSEAISLMGAADFGYYPEKWTNESYPDRIGLSSDAYRFYILVNNSQENLIDQNQSLTDLTNELVSFDHEDMGFGGIDYNSSSIYNETGGIVDYSRTGDVVTFSVNIAANSTKWFAVYFDYDSNFTDRSVSVTGTNNLRETLFPAEKISLLQYRKMQRLQSLDYDRIKFSTGTFFDFFINISDVGGATVLAFGGKPTSESNIISLQRYVIYQNSTAGISKGRMSIRVW